MIYKMFRRFFTLWFLGFLVSIYVLVASVFPIIMIPFSLLNEQGTSSFNSIANSLAVSYLMGLFVYHLTVKRKNDKERKKRKWELDKLLTDISRHFEPVEDETGRIDKITGNSLKNLKKEIYETFIKNMTDSLDKAFLYKEIMNNAESDAFAEIRRLLGGIINPPSCMDDEEAKRNADALKKIQTELNKIRQSIDKLCNRK